VILYVKRSYIVSLYLFILTTLKKSFVKLNKQTIHKMKKQTWIWIIGIIATTLTVYLFISLIFNKGISKPEIHEFSPYISGYSSGVISKTNSIKVQLSNDFAKNLAAVDDRPIDLFHLNPDIKGSVGWIDYRTIQFIPEKPLESDKTYHINFDLSKLDNSIERRYRIFEFSLKVKPQNFNIEITEIKTIDKTKLAWQQIIGIIQTADNEEIEHVEKLLNSQLNGKEYPVKIQQKSATYFDFIIDSVPRLDKANTMYIHYDGSALDIEKSGKLEVEIPSVHDFKILDIRLVQHPDQYVVLQFSDPIMENQFLDGLIQISDVELLNFSVQDNIIRIYPPERLEGEHTLKIYSGIKNCLSHPFDTVLTRQIRFEQILPAVRMIDEGVIMPKSEGSLLLPFEAVSLNAVDVRIIKIFENNIMQFLQVNDMTDNNEITRVGKVVKEKTIFLNQTDVTDLGQWNRFTLDLNELIQTDPGAIYRVEIGFRKSHAIYPCDNQQTINREMTSTVSSEENNEFWKKFDYYCYSDDGWYSWEYQDDPCHEAYYGYRRAVKRNVYASNLGLMVKEGNDGSILAVVTDLLSSEPLKDIHVDLYNYQQQLIVSQKTDKNGVAIFESLSNNEEPEFVIATSNSDKAYLKINDGNSLSISDFDVGGVDVSEGLKGFIYAERGVWRPGDSIYIGFILEDIRKELPQAHPVVFELLNPQSQVVDKQVQNLNQWYFHVFRTKTDADATTGNYTVRIRIGGKVFYKSLPIETIKPNRLDIDLHLTNNVLYAYRSNPVELSLHWLHGAPAKEIKTNINLSLYPTSTNFEMYKDYRFDDETRGFEYKSQKILEAYTDANGKIVSELDFNSQMNAPGKLMAKLSIKAFEKGGNFSIQEQQYSFHPYKSYIGIKIDNLSRSENYISTDKTHKIDIVKVNNEGELIKEDHQVQLELIKVKWSWWYYSYDYNSNYTSSEYFELINKASVSLINGKAQWDLNIERENWGYYIVRITDFETGHACSQRLYADWPEYAGVGRNQAKSASILQFKTDKEKYDFNESVKLTIPGAEGARAFISIENGSRVLDYFWFETEEGENEFSFNLSEEMTPNVYIHLSLVQAHEQTANDRPLRMYGVVPILVENQQTHLNPILKMPETLKAESEVKLEITERDKKDMTYTIAIVDEGLLALTNFETPNPWDYFYDKEALGVKTWDMYDLVVGAHGERLERILSIGGGGTLNKEAAQNINRFTPMVKFIGPFHLKGGKKVVHKIQLPKYIGAVRTMVIAANEEGAYGSVSKNCPVTKPLMVLGTLPRVLAPDEEVLLPVTLFAMRDDIKNVNVSISTNKHIEIIGEKEKNVNFGRIGDQTINFRLKTADLIGKGEIEIVATSGEEKSTFPIEIEIRNPNPNMLISKYVVINQGETWEYNFDKFGMSETNLSKMEVYSIPPIQLQKRLSYLRDYPHSCLEQRVSAAFPCLYLNHIRALSATDLTENNLRINNTIKQIRKYQLSNGGFGYWPGSENVNLWATNYAGHFLIEAKENAFDIPEAVLSAWSKFQKQRALKWLDDGPQSQYIQAYRLYTLALQGKPVLSAMNRLRQTNNLTEMAKWRLAASYQLSGKTKIAEELIAELTTNVKPYQELSGTFGSALRDKAMILETLILLNKKEDAFLLIRNMSDELGSENWISTHTTAYALLSIGKYLKQFGSTNSIELDYQLNNNQSVSQSSEDVVLSIPLNIEDKNTIKIKNNSEGIIYAGIVQQGIPKQGTEFSSSNKLAMQVRYLTLDGNSINPTKLEQGQDFVCEVKISHTGYETEFESLALTQIFPSGWEIINPRLFSTNLGENSYSEYQDIKDDRIHTYFDIKKGKTLTYRILLNASYAGKFYLPAFNLEAMYDKSIHARNTGQWVQVIPPQN
jgi:alpha-2-macroglobulin